MEIFEILEKLYRWKAKRTNPNYQKAVIEYIEKHKEVMDKFHPLLENYPPEPGENYKDWEERVMGPCLLPPDFWNIWEILDLPFYKKWGVPFPMPHTIEYPHPHVLSRITDPLRPCNHRFDVKFLGDTVQYCDDPDGYLVKDSAKENSESIVLEINLKASDKNIVREMKCYLAIWRSGQKPEKQERERERDLETDFKVYKMVGQGLTAREIAKSLWPEKYRKWEEKLDRTLDKTFIEEEIRKRQEIEVLTKKYMKEGKEKCDAWNLAEEKTEKNSNLIKKKTNPLIWKVSEHYQKAKVFLDNPALIRKYRCPRGGTAFYPIP